MGKGETWREKHPALWEFLLFNVLSNVSTLVRFAATWLGTALMVGILGLTAPFRFLLFDYTTAGSNGIGGFLTFLLAEVLAQTVNFFVQKHLVFRSDAGFAIAAPRFAVLAVIIVLFSLVLPGHVTTWCQEAGLADGFAATIASAVNTLLAVVISYPLLKFWVMPKGA